MLFMAGTLLAGALTFVSLFFVENVFRQEVVHRRPAAAQHAVVAPRASRLVARMGPGSMSDRTEVGGTPKKEGAE